MPNEQWCLKKGTCICIYKQTTIKNNFKKSMKIWRIFTWAASKATVLDPGTGPGRQQQQEQEGAIKIHFFSTQAKIRYWSAFNPTHGPTKLFLVKPLTLIHIGAPSDDSAGFVCLPLRPVGLTSILGIWIKKLPKPLKLWTLFTDA